jgi:hypothetical protein
LLSRLWRPADPEAQVGAVAPQRRQQLGRALLTGRKPLEVIESRQVGFQRRVG